MNGDDQPGFTPGPGGQGEDELTGVEPIAGDAAVAAAFVDNHPEEAARRLERASPDDVAGFLSTLDAERAANLFRALGPGRAAACASQLEDSVLSAIIDALPLDAAVNALRGVDAPRYQAILDATNTARRDRLRAALEWPDGSAGMLSDPLALAVTDDLTVAEAQKQLRDPRQHLFHYVYVVDRDQRLVGVMAIRDLMAARPRQEVRALMRAGPLRLDAHADLGTVAMHPAWRDYDALPVVDRDGHLIGAIRHKTIRRMSWARGRPIVETLVGLSEVYWAGLSGLLASLASTRDEPPSIQGTGG